MSDYPKIQQEISQPISENLQKLASLFPASVKDGELDIEALREELGDFAEIQPGDEKYELNWVGKQAAKKKTFEPLLGKTLALKDDGKNTDTTENLYIEGDNLEALKLLRQNYYGEVKMIYIDPPYNTGKDFVYTDKFKVSQEESEEEEGAVSESGERLVKNEKSSNRFHARWLDMMYPRLRLAKDLLREDGVIFISIDDNEVHNLREVCDEIFGTCNFVANIVWEKMYTVKNDSSLISSCQESLIIYSKAENQKSISLLPRTAEMDARYSNVDNDERGSWKAIPLYADGLRTNGSFEVISHTGVVHLPPEGTHWRYAQKDVDKLIAEKRIWFGKDGNAKPNLKRFLTEVQQGVKSKNLWKHSEVGSNDSASREMKQIFPEGSIFSYPKPSSLLKQCCKIGTVTKSDIILDFFSGSASTAHAVMQLNAEDGGSRKHIMVQLPEICDEQSAAAKAGYLTITEIGKERIRRAGEKIVANLHAQKADLEKKGELELDDNKETNPYILRPESLDIGFKSFRIEDTKINWLKKDLRGEDIIAEAGFTTADALDFVPGFTDTDVVYELMLRQSNIPLTLPITQPVDGASRTYLYGDSYLICLEVEISKELVEQLAALEPTPLKYFFRDSAFGKDIALKDETFRRLNAEIAKNTADQADAYTVEFI